MRKKTKYMFSPPISFLRQHEYLFVSVIGRINFDEKHNNDIKRQTNEHMIHEIIYFFMISQSLSDG